MDYITAFFSDGIDAWMRLWQAANPAGRGAMIIFTFAGIVWALDALRQHQHR